MPKETKDRKGWLDVLRLLAGALVLLCHAVEEGVYELVPEQMALLSVRSKGFAFFCFTVGRLGVPFFLLISGYLLLDKTYKGEAILRFWKEKWFHLLICTQCWFMAYDVFLLLWQKAPLTPVRIIQDVLFFYKVDMSHVWYMPMILGLYVLIPFAAAALQAVEGRYLCFPFLFFWIFLFIYPQIGTIAQVLHSSRVLTPQISAGFSGGIYGLYMVSGYLLKKGMFSKVSKAQLILLTGLSLAAGTGIQLWACQNHVRANIWYDSPFLWAAAVALFELVSRTERKQGYGVVTALSKYTFGIYLVHFPIKLLLVPFVISLPLMKPLQVISLWSLMMTCSFFFVFLLGKIPRIGKYILYFK